MLNLFALGGLDEATSIVRMFRSIKYYLPRLTAKPQQECCQKTFENWGISSIINEQ